MIYERYVSHVHCMISPVPAIIKRKIIPDKFENILSKYKSRGLIDVADFLSNKARRSKRTAVAFSFGLDHFNNFIVRNYNSYNIQTILEPIKEEGKKKKQINVDVYKLLNQFVSYLQNDTTNGHDLSPKSVKLYMTAAKSYLAYNDIELTPTKFKNRVTMPTVYHEGEEAIDAKDIREILNHCNNRRLKAYLLVLASGGMRAVEALAIREGDIHFNSSPTEVLVRKEYAKTRRERRVYISDEATGYLKQWLDWKYRDRHVENRRLNNINRSKDDLVFSIHTGKNPQALYNKVLIEFQKVLDLTSLTSRKEDGVYKRRKVTFHSFRRFVKTTITNQCNTDYSEWFLGHAQSSYYRNKTDELREIYKQKCMKYLTFLSYPTVEATGKSYAAQLEQRDQLIQQQDQKIEQLTQRDKDNTERITQLEAQFNELITTVKQTLHIPPTKEEHLSREQVNTMRKEILTDNGIPDQEAEYLVREMEIENEKIKRKQKTGQELS
jgi:integrase